MGTDNNSYASMVRKWARANKYTHPLLAEARLKLYEALILLEDACDTYGASELDSLIANVDDAQADVRMFVINWEEEHGI